LWTTFLDVFSKKVFPIEFTRSRVAFFSLGARENEGTTIIDTNGEGDKYGAIPKMRGEKGSHISSHVTDGHKEGIK
jgi:hypothetical protein